MRVFRSKTKYFPWRLFSKFVFGHFLLVIPALAVTLYFFKNHLQEKISQQAPDVNLADLDFDLTALFLLMTAIFVFSTVVMGKQVAQSLGRIIYKARALAGKGGAISDSPTTGDEIFHDEPGEFSELESDLNNIKKSLIETSEKADKEVSELEVLMSKITDAVIAVDKEGYPLFYNSRFAIFFGEQELMGEGKHHISRIFRNPDVLNTFDLAMAGNKNTSIVTKLHRISKKDDRYFSISVAPLMQKDSGNAYGAIGIFHDITKLKMAEKIRIEFVSNVSHELRTPITSIKGYCDTLVEDLSRGGVEAAELNTYLATISRNVNRLWHLVNDLLDLSSLESGEEVSKDQIELKEFTKRVLHNLEDKLQRKSQELVVEINTPYVMVDAKRVEQVMVNLVENAIKYIPEKGQIKVVWDVGPQNTTLLRVIDNGPGIHPSHLPRLFERFYRVDKARSREMGGTGLGLAIVKHIMQRHGGQIEVNSRVGQGTEFICSFP